MRGSGLHLAPLGQRIRQFDQVRPHLGELRRLAGILAQALRPPDEPTKHWPQPADDHQERCQMPQHPEGEAAEELLGQHLQPD
jgi:hypothetical protein